MPCATGMLLTRTCAPRRGRISLSARTLHRVPPGLGPAGNAVKCIRKSGWLVTSILPATDRQSLEARCVCCRSLPGSRPRFERLGAAWGWDDGTVSAARPTGRTAGFRPA